MYGVQLIAIFAGFSNHTELKQARNNTAHQESLHDHQECGKK